MHERAGDCDPLLFATRQCIHEAVKPIPEPDLIQYRNAPLTGMRSTHAIELQYQPYVFLHVQGRHEVEELIDKTNVLAAEQRQMRLCQRGDIETVDGHRATVGTIDPADEIQQCGFARAAAAHDSHHLAIGKLGIRMIENTMLPLTFTEAATQIRNAQHDTAPAEVAVPRLLRKNFPN